MTFSLVLVIVTCFAMSFALRSDAIARLVLDACLLHCTRVAIPTLVNCADQSFCWMRDLVFSLLFACCRARSFCLPAEWGLLFRAPSLFSFTMHRLSAECGRLC